MIRTFVLLTVLLISAGHAGEVVEVKDPRYFERQQVVIFPKAEVKLVTFEFEATDQRGKQRAKELHNEFLAKIRDLHGGAIITFVTPVAQRIENLRVQAEQVAKQQQAQMVLWGRIFIDDDGTSLINARLMLIEPPPGISADYVKTADLGANAQAVGVRGVIDAPITQLRIDFNTVENDVSTIAYFLSGLARYYKGAAREGSEAVRWLSSSVADFESYLNVVSEKVDRTALSRAHLYVARAEVRLADAKPARAAMHLDRARHHADEAEKLNPFNADVHTVEAVIAARQGATPSVLRDHLARAVSLAPNEANARINLAVLDSAAGNVKSALRQLDIVNFARKSQNLGPLPTVDELRRQLAPYAGR